MSSRDSRGWSEYRMQTRVRLLRVFVACLVASCARDGSRSDSATARADGPAPTDRRRVWVITPRGFGPLQVGMSRAQAEAAVGGSLAIKDDSTWTNCAYI